MYIISQEMLWERGKLKVGIPRGLALKMIQHQATRNFSFSIFPIDYSNSHAVLSQEVRRISLGQLCMLAYRITKVKIPIQKSLWGVCACQCYVTWEPTVTAYSTLSEPSGSWYTRSNFPGSVRAMKHNWIIFTFKTLRTWLYKKKSHDK